MAKLEAFKFREPSQVERLLCLCAHLCLGLELDLHVPDMLQVLVHPTKLSTVVEVANQLGICKGEQTQIILYSGRKADFMRNGMPLKKSRIGNVLEDIHEELLQVWQQLGKFTHVKIVLRMH